MDSFRTRRLRPAVVLVFLSCCLPLVAHAAGSGYEAPKDYAIEWAGRISLLGVLAAGALIGYVLVVRRATHAPAAIPCRAGL